VPFRPNKLSEIDVKITYKPIFIKKKITFLLIVVGLKCETVIQEQKRQKTEKNNLIFFLTKYFHDFKMFWGKKFP
jgi:hypothetical protein